MMQIFVRAYRDSDGDGEGDLPGLVEKLDYLQQLGVRGILLTPVSPSQDRDHGYLTTNYRDVAPDYGSLADLDALIAAAHARGLGVLLDEVFDYSGSSHPGFAAARGSASGPWRDWYVWSAADPGWGRAWWETPSGWYYGFFGQDNPQLDGRNPAVLAYHRDTLVSWLNRGVDGFRLDAAPYLVQSGPTATADQPQTLAADAGFRDVLSRYENRMLLCEAPGNPALYAGSNVCGGGFLFSLVTEQRAGGGTVTSQAAVLAAAQRPGSAAALAQLALAPMYAPVGSMGTFLANNDRFAGARLWNQFGGDTPAYRLAAATLLLMPGTPFLYYGEEIGMAETSLPTAWPDSDYHLRGVMSWTGDADNAGFSSSRALDGPAALTNPDAKYLKPVPNAGTHNVVAEAQDPASLLGHYRALIALRHAHDALARGLYRVLRYDDAAWVFERWHADEDLLVAVNYASTPHALAVSATPGTYQVLYAYGASPGPLTVDPGGATTVTLPASSAVVYRLAWNAPPLGTLYVRGSNNGYAAPDADRLAYLGGGRYEGTIQLPAGGTYFKLSTASWDPAVNVGIVGGGTITLGQALQAEQTWWRDNGVGSDLHVTVPSAGTYRFTVAADDPYRPVLTIVAAP
jgi:glycosidase